MADQELRQRRAGQEVLEVRKKQRAERVYKIEKAPEPTNWFLIIMVILLIGIVISAIVFFLKK